MSATHVSKKRIDIHDYKYRMKQVNDQIERELSPENVLLIKKYDREMVSQSIAIATRQKHLRTLLTLSRLLNKDWEDVTKEDVDDLVFQVMDQFADENGQETHYSYDHKKILKIFFRWYKLGSREFVQVGDPPETRNVKVKKVRDKIAREDLLNEEDRIKLLHACGENARDRALIDCHMEAGTRPGEILNLKIKHVLFDKNGAVLQVDGKTGARTIRIVRATPSLAAWISMHPFKDDPEKQLNLFLQVVDKLGEHDIKLLLKRILKSKNGKKMIKKILELPIKDQTKIANKMNDAIKMVYRYEKLEKSLKNFKKKIKEHKESDNKDEHDIHAFIVRNYWLLGIEYFDKKILSDLDGNEKQTGDTLIGKKRPDFIIRKLDRLDKCVVIELEEANDKIFKINGTLSKEVFDGINQAVNYNIEQKLKGLNSKGIAVIGSIHGMELSEEEKHRLKLLGEHYHNIDILTYEDLIQQSEMTLDFWKSEQQDTD